MSVLDWLPVYLAIGGVVGFLAGLLGIGGGMVMVPMLVFVFRAQNVDAAHLMHLSLATAMAAMLFTSVASVRAHHVRGSVDWGMARAMVPGIIMGGFAAAIAAGFIPTRPLAVMFTLLIFYAGTQMLIEVQPKTARVRPGPATVFTAGAVIGGVSSLLAAGGAFLSIPFLTWSGVPLRRAIGTAAANGFPIAAAGTAGYVLQGLRVEGLPAWSLGYVYAPALLLVVTTSMFAAPLGARVAHRLPVRRLRILFSLIMYALAARLVVSLW